MDNFMLIQSAQRRRAAGERTGFSALSRTDQADRLAAWQASADAAATYTPDPDERPSAVRREAAQDMPDMFFETEYARRAAPSEPPPDSQPDAQPMRPARSFALYNGIMARHDQVFGPHT